MIRVATRSSPLAKLQVEEVFRHLQCDDFEMLCARTYGDEHREISLLETTRPDLFTDALDEMLFQGEVDLAVHSAKDLAVPLPAGLTVAALTSACDKTDCLVSQNSVAFEQLPSGARVGTSSASRRAQLLACRPDLDAVGIRGTIEERIACVDSGNVDAIIVAMCALKRLGLMHRAAQVLPFRTHPLQGHLAVVTRVDRPDMRVLFDPIDIRTLWGKVWLVGCGPGNPELMTIKAHHLLEHADVVFYDDLIDASVLPRYPGTHTYVGKRKQRHSHTQDEINAMLYQAALDGKRVVRLKGGDPFIFGRGGEEVHYLRSRLVAVEVVPGVSAAQAAAACLKAPLTERGLASAVTFLSGHRAGKTEAAAHSDPTRVYYMAASNLAELSNRLIAEGMDAATPVALVQSASCAAERTMLTTIAGMAPADCTSPLCVIVGSVAGRAEQPLRLLYTGLDPYVMMCGEMVMHYPLICTEPVAVPPFDMSRYDAIVFSSRSAVKHFLSRFSPSGLPLIAIGPGTRRALESYGCTVAQMPDRADSDALAALLSQSGYQCVLYPCSNRSDNVLHTLRTVAPVVCYATLPVKQPRIDLSGFATIAFTSPSTVDAFRALYNEIPGHVVCRVWGPRTAGKLRACGVPAERILCTTLDTRNAR
jgi:uroporphyrinogen III methyltransferase/synthase